MSRIDKTNYYLDIAEAVLGRGSCIRRNFGAVIVNNDQIISSGYTGAPRGRKNCVDTGKCTREALNIPRGQRYELCRSVHAEANAIINAPRNLMINGVLYLVGKDYKTGEYVQNTSPCAMCKRFIINSGVDKIVIRQNKTNFVTINTQYFIDNDDSIGLISSE